MSTDLVNPKTGSINKIITIYMKLILQSIFVYKFKKNINGISRDSVVNADFEDNSHFYEKHLTQLITLVLFIEMMV